MTRRRALIDCFTFATELDLLEFRLRLLDGVVDRFVIVEATKTHGGHDKPLFFDQNADRFRRFSSKIVHVAVDDLPAPVPDRWVPENFQRNAITRGIEVASTSGDDLVIVGDLDEIPDPAVLDRLRGSTCELVGVGLRACYFRANWEGPLEWPLLRAAQRDRIVSPQELRESDPLLWVHDAGAHLSYLMTPSEVARKRSWIAESPESDRERDTTHIQHEAHFGVVSTLEMMLAVRGRPELNAVQVQLLQDQPRLFDFRSFPPSVQRRAFRKYSVLRTRPAFPSPVVRAADRVLDRISRHTTLPEWSAWDAS